MVTDFFVVELNSTCPDTIRRVVSPATGLADVDLSRNGLRQKIKLPIGSYQYELMFKNLNCSVKIEVKGNVHTANILTDDMDCLKGPGKQGSTGVKWTILVNSPCLFTFQVQI